MIIRIVKMTFKPESLNDFIRHFKSVKEQIRYFEGCHELILYKEISNSNVVFTCSRWTDETALNNYRESDVFKSTWRIVKPLFAERAEAYSLLSTDQQELS